jgi:hypothetical protein
MKQQTAVEWLIEQKLSRPWEEIIEEAKAIEQLEIYAAYEAGWINGDLKKSPRFGSDYYDNLFGQD